MHNKITTCAKCDRVEHYKCSLKSFKYDQLQNIWSCWECAQQMTEPRYNPFRSIFYDKYQQEDPAVSAETNKIIDILENCNLYDKESFNKDPNLNNNGEDFSICFNNVDGMASNFDELSSEILLLKKKFDVITIAETNISSENKGQYQLPGYQSVFLSKNSLKSKGSGLGIYIKDIFIYDEIEVCTHVSENLESLFIKVNNTHTPITIGVIYRPPSGNLQLFLSEFDSVMGKLPTSNVFITGDFNIDLLKSRTNTYENVFYSHGFTPLISIATHYKPGCKPSCIDNIFCNSSDTVLASGVLENSASHHNPVFCLVSHHLNTETDTECSKPKYDYSQSNIDTFVNMIDSKMTENQFTNDELGYQGFCEYFSETIDKCFLTDPNHMPTSRRNRYTNPWITNGIIASISKKAYLYKTWKKSFSKSNPNGDETLYGKYKDYRKELLYLIRCAKRNHYNKKFEAVSGNSKKTWELINQLRGKFKPQLKPSFVINGKLVRERRIIANEFNKYFVSIAHKMNVQLQEGDNSSIPITPIPSFTDFLDSRVTESIYMSSCTPEEVSCIIKDLDNGKASDICITVVKQSSKIISHKLCSFFNTFIEKGTFPDLMKIGNICPVYKKGNPQTLGNYRPVSTLPLFGKIFEKIIYSRLYNYLISKNIIYEKQFGFRKGHSTSHAINYSVDNVLKCIENKKHVLGIFIDLSKAFDTLDHEKLMVKLENYGIRGNCYQLMKSYISSRKQYSTFLNTKSDQKTVMYGVPQGSVLGPLLFLLYINDIVNVCSNGTFVLFADDTNIFIAADTEHEVYRLANRVLMNVTKYMVSNQLHINIGKCSYMHFQPNLNNAQRMTCSRTRIYDHSLNLFLNGTKLSKVDKVRFLGVIIDDKLSWEPHIKHLESKLNLCIVMIKRIKKFIPKSHYGTLYHSLFVSHLSYCISAWGGTHQSKLQKIFAIQKRCLRILYGEQLSFDHPEFYQTCARVRTYESHVAEKDFTLEHTKPIFNKHNFLTLHHLYHQSLFMETLKILKWHRPISMFSLLQVNDFSKRHLLIPPKVTLDISKNNFLYKSSLIWNYLIQKVLVSPPLDKYTGTVIPGSIMNSDLSASIGFVKNSSKQFLLNVQKQGDSDEWSPHNFNLFIQQLNR